MAGHSKWSNIKRKKAKVDAQKGKVYSKLSKMIIVATREGGPDPENNFRLSDMIEKAKAANMPNENIERAIKKGSGELGGANIEEIVYEGYGPSGVAIMLDATTDNRNRTAGELRHIFDKHSGNLGESGCVAWMFDRKGLIIIEKTADVDIEEIMMIVIDAGAEDIEEHDDSIEIETDVETFSAVKAALKDNDIAISSAEVTYIPKSTVEISKEESEKVENLINILEEHDDVQNVYFNCEICGE